jgi:hypothetical protein
VKSADGVKSDLRSIQITVLVTPLSRLCGALQPWAKPRFMRTYGPLSAALDFGHRLCPQKLRPIAAVASVAAAQVCPVLIEAIESASSAVSDEAARKPFIG